MPGPHLDRALSHLRQAIGPESVGAGRLEVEPGNEPTESATP